MRKIVYRNKVIVNGKDEFINKRFGAKITFVVKKFMEKCFLLHSTGSKYLQFKAKKTSISANNRLTNDN